MRRKMRMINVLLLTSFSVIILAGCVFSKELVINRYADALLTKNNEIQFRFRINNESLERYQLYKVKITIHDKQLAAAIGKQEIVYGEDQVSDGEYLQVEGNNDKYIFMDPIPLKKDLHIHELESMIENHKAVSIVIYNDQEVFGRVYLTNFSSEL